MQISKHRWSKRLHRQIRRGKKQSFQAISLVSWAYCIQFCWKAPSFIALPILQLLASRFLQFLLLCCGDVLPCSGKGLSPVVLSQEVNTSHSVMVIALVGVPGSSVCLLWFVWFWLGFFVCFCFANAQPPRVFQAQCKRRGQRISHCFADNSLKLILIAKEVTIPLRRFVLRDKATVLFRLCA